MSNQPHSNEQLASLLIDGRLTGADLASANERLASDTEFADEVAALRAQRELFATLPKFRTPADFSDRALEASVDQVRAIVGELNFYQSQSVESAYAGSVTPGSTERSSAYTWRTAIMAVASLAGMILLTLFVFPQAFNVPGTVASLKKSNDDSNNGSVKMDGVPDAPAATESVDDVIQDDEESIDSSFEDMVSRGKGGGGRGGFGGRGGGGGFGGGGDALVDSQLKKQIAEGGVRARSGDFNENEVIVKEEADRNQLATNQAHTLPGAFSGTPMKLPSPTINSKTQAPSVEQIWYVDMNNFDQPLESVGKVLLTNDIQVQLDNQMKNAGQSFQVKKLDQPFEALYVNATQSQMKQALISLSGQAEISSMPLALNAPNAATSVDIVGVQRADANVEAPIVQQQGSSVPESIKFNDRNKSLAQQLVRTPLNRSQSWVVPPIPSSDDPALEALEKAEKGLIEKRVADAGEMGLTPPSTISQNVPVQGSVAPAVQSARARQSVALPTSKGDRGAAVVQSQSFGSSSTVSDEQIAPWFGNDDDQQLRQYLLLVRTPNDVNAANAANAAKAPNTPNAILKFEETRLKDSEMPAEANSDQK